MPIDYKIRNLRRLFGEATFLRPQTNDLSQVTGKMAKHYARKVFQETKTGNVASSDGGTPRQKPRSIGSGSAVRNTGGGIPRAFFSESAPRSIRNKAVSSQLFTTHLFEKQKMKLYYGCMRDDQFRRYVARARSKRQDVDAELLRLLELRLDTVLYRTAFVKTPAQARHWIHKGALRVNAQKVNMKSFSVTPGDLIAVADDWAERAFVAAEEAGECRKMFGCGASWIVSRNDPAGMIPWLEIDRAGLTALVVRNPTNDEMRAMTNAALFPFIRDANLNPHAAMRAYR